jgi:hypothetical protein
MSSLAQRQLIDPVVRFREVGVHPGR